MAEKKKPTPKTPFEKIGAAYESEARRQEKSGNTEMATKTRKAAAKSMTPENKKALEEDTQKAKERKMASKKSKLKGTAVSKDKTDAVDAAGAKAKDAVGKAKERNPIDESKKESKVKGSATKDKKESKLKGSAVKDKKESKLKGSAVQGDKQGPPSPAGSADNTGSGPSTQRTPKPSSKDSAPADDDRPNFGSVAEQREKNPPPGDPGYTFGSVAEQREKAGPVKPSKLRAGAEGTSGKSGPAFRQNDITKEMPETRREKDQAREARIRDLATSSINKDPNDKYTKKDLNEKGINITRDPNDKGINKDPSNKGEMPDDPKPRDKPTVLVTPTDKGEMPTPKEAKPGLMSRLRSRIGSFTSRPGAPAAPAAPPAPPAPPSGGGGGATPPTPPSGGGYPPAPPAPSEGKSLPDPTPDLPKALNTQNSGFQINRGINNTGNITAAEGANVFSVSGEGNQLVGDRNTTQNITGGAGEPITATTSGKATSSGGRGITASTSGTATTKPAHPRAQNASRGSRPTSKKK